ncbi:VOC family protein [Acetobacter okinawensis]|uniref:VOC family protein n=1 Tax=Acetobacter okinawensis TaxID=1076594 RepID=UPI001BA8C7E5|nr:VOC family protein [Acetobacter okinawensis]MBS0966978.1 VOC family protein [Acetobacter okinawensis]
MYFHVMVGANDLEASKTFYDATFAALGVASKGKFRDDPTAYMYGEAETGLFFVTKTMDGNAATCANGGTIMFKAPSKAALDAWYSAGIANGGADFNGTPAPGGVPDTTMGYLRDPTGNKIAAVAFG